jgi:hypothetical protein
MRPDREMESATMLKRVLCLGALVSLLSVALAGVAGAADKVTINTGVDLYSRYIWRGLDIASTPSVQPSLSVTYSGLKFGAWGAYTLSNQSSGSDEIDFWLSYSWKLDNGASVTAIATDYYFPNAGIKFFNFNDYDALDDEGNPDPGAHTLELGASVTGPESFPAMLSGYVNVHNDAGNNAYFQVDYPVAVGKTNLGLFCGAALGNKDNPDYYGTDGFSAINVGVTAGRDIEMTESFSLPLSLSLIVNPSAEITYLIVGMSF